MNDNLRRCGLWDTVLAARAMHQSTQLVSAAAVYFSLDQKSIFFNTIVMRI